MDFRPTSEQQDLHDRAQRLLGDRFSSELVRDAEASVDGFPRALWEAGVELGWPRLSLPPSPAGDGGRLLDLCLVLEQTGQAAATLPLIVSGGVASTLLGCSPQTAERDRLLDSIAAGSIVAPAFVDDDGRNEWDVPRLRLTGDGDGYRLAGTKVLVPFGAVADEFVVTTVTDDGETAVVAVDAARDGVEITRHHSKVGVPLAVVELRDVRLPPERLVCSGDDARAALHSALQVGTLLSTAEAVGMCEALVTMTAAHVTQRMAFGRPIGTFQAVAHPCADMRVSVDAVRILVQQAAWLVDNGRSADEEIPAAKGLANELFETVANDAYRLHGALGFSNECDVQLFTRRLQGFFGSFGETQESFERAAAAIGM